MERSVTSTKISHDSLQPIDEIMGKQVAHETTNHRKMKNHFSLKIRYSLKRKRENEKGPAFEMLLLSGRPI